VSRFTLAALGLALCSEVCTSLWIWLRSPTDSLRVWYQGSFVAYESERLLPWFIVFAILWGALSLVRRYISEKG